MVGIVYVRRANKHPIGWAHQWFECINTLILEWLGWYSGGGCWQRTCYQPKKGLTLECDFKSYVSFNGGKDSRDLWVF